VPLRAARSAASPAARVRRFACGYGQGARAINGKIDTDEWDELYTANGMTAYFQYEPGKFHIAATLPPPRSSLRFPSQLG